MPNYRYTAIDSRGGKVRGTCEAGSEAEARQKLREDGLLPLHVSAAGGLNLRAASGRRRRWPRSERVLFARQLAALLQAGMPVEAALAALFEQSDHPHTLAIIAELRRCIAGGLSLSAAMSEHTGAFDTMTCALTRIGEKSGRLSEIMNDIADHLEAGDHFRQRMTVAMIYPAAILIVALLVIGGLLIHVVPQIIEIFSRQQQALPLLTRALIAASDALRAGFWPLLALATASVVALTHLWHRPGGRDRLTTLLSQLPVIGGLLRTSGTQRLAAALAMALRGGVPLVPALTLCEPTLALPAQRRALGAIIDAVSRGASFTAALCGGRDAPLRQFSPSLKHYIALGEQNGRLGDMLAQVARQQRSALEYRLGWFAGLLEPALIVLMGGLVLAIVLAIMLPIIEANQFLR
jgi:general secretion pathway protein F